MSQLTSTLGLIFMSLILVNCERKAATESHVAIQLPTSSKIGTYATCTTCLKAIVLKVEGEGFSKIVTSLIHTDITASDSELSGVINVEVPTGSARKFSIMAFYRNSDKSITVVDGIKSIDLIEQSPPPIEVQLNEIAQLRGGGLVGRYLTDVDKGPTGPVSLQFHHPTDADLTFTIEKGEIINGWFNFFASENFPVSYHFEGLNQPLFNKVTIESLVPLAGSAAAASNVGRIHRPSHYYRFDGSWALEEEYHDIVYGFFGASALTSNKFVCFEAGTHVLDKMSLDSEGSALMNYHHNSQSVDVYGIDGLNSSNSPCLNSPYAPRFSSDKIAINAIQMNGNGNDSATGMAGIFTYFPTAGNTQIAKSELTSDGLFKIKSIDGLLANAIVAGTMFNGIKIFKKSNAVNGGFDDLKCRDGWLVNSGFTELGVADFRVVPEISTNQATFALAAGNTTSTDGYVVCPVASNTMQEFGGMYLGKLVFPYLQGSASVFSQVTSQTIQISNIGSDIANGMFAVVSSENSQFQFLGGSSPGTTGTCTSNLNSTQTCTYVVNHIGVRDDIGQLIVTFGGGQSLSVLLSSDIF